MEEKAVIAMKELARKVMSDYRDLPVYEMIGRILKLENISPERAIKGYKIMRENQIIPDEFVRGGLELEVRTMKTISLPNVQELISRMDCTFEPVPEGSRSVEVPDLEPKQKPDKPVLLLGLDANF